MLSCVLCSWPLYIFSYDTEVFLSIQFHSGQENWFYEITQLTDKEYSNDMRCLCIRETKKNFTDLKVRYSENIEI